MATRVTELITALRSELEVQGYVPGAFAAELESADGDIRVVLDLSDEMVRIVRVTPDRARLIMGEATFTGSMIAAAYTLLVEG